MVGRLIAYKRHDIAIRAFNALGLPLKIIGRGPEMRRLQKMAKGNIEFLGRISDEELRRRYSESQAFIFPAEEDAGIMPLEAMSCGTPVIAYAAGGALETVVGGKTGLFFNEQSVEAIKQAVQVFDVRRFDVEVIRNHAKQFDKLIFRQRIKSLVDNWYANFKAANIEK